jgi:hypothetical protein
VDHIVLCIGGFPRIHLHRGLEVHSSVNLSNGTFTSGNLCTAGNPEVRIARFHERVEEVDGIPLQVIENTASAGDVILMHSLLLHAAAPVAHLGTQPRFLLNQDITQPYW